MNYDENPFYNNNEKNFQTGDAIFVKGKNTLIDKLILFFTGSSFIHTAILIKVRGLWFIVETRNSSYYGYQMVPLDWWIARHHQDEMYLGKMPKNTSNIRINIRNIVMNSVESMRPYKLSWICITYLLQVCMGKFRPNLSKFFKGPKPLICSTLVQEAWERAGAIETTNYMTPGGLVDFIGGEKSLIPLGQYEDSSIEVYAPEQLDLISI